MPDPDNPELAQPLTKGSGAVEYLQRQVARNIVLRVVVEVLVYALGPALLFKGLALITLHLFGNLLSDNFMIELGRYRSKLEVTLAAAALLIRLVAWSCIEVDSKLAHHVRSIWLLAHRSKTSDLNCDSAQDHASHFSEQVIRLPHSILASPSYSAFSASPEEAAICPSAVNIASPKAVHNSEDATFTTHLQGLATQATSVPSSERNTPSPSYGVAIQPVPLPSSSTSVLSAATFTEHSCNEPMADPVTLAIPEASQEQTVQDEFNDLHGDIGTASNHDSVSTTAESEGSGCKNPTDCNQAGEQPVEATEEVVHAQEEAIDGTVQSKADNTLDDEIMAQDQLSVCTEVSLQENSGQEHCAQEHCEQEHCGEEHDNTPMHSFPDDSSGHEQQVVSPPEDTSQNFSQGDSIPDGSQDDDTLSRKSSQDILLPENFSEDNPLEEDSLQGEPLHDDFVQKGTSRQELLEDTLPQDVLSQDDSSQDDLSQDDLSHGDSMNKFLGASLEDTSQHDLLSNQNCSEDNLMQHSALSENFAPDSTGDFSENITQDDIRMKDASPENSPQENTEIAQAIQSEHPTTDLMREIIASRSELIVMKHKLDTTVQSKHSHKVLHQRELSFMAEKSRAEREVLQRQLNAISKELFMTRGNYWTMCRPRAATDASDKEFVTIKSDKIVQTQQVVSQLGGGTRNLVHEYEFDRAFSKYETDEEVANSVEPMISAFLNGVSVSVFADGYSGTGKTHTLFGGEFSVARLAAKQIFNHFQIKQLPLAAAQLTAFEVYNNKVFDLLHTSPTELDVSPGRFLKHKEQLVRNCRSAAELTQAIEHIIATRQTRAARHNHVSSRSHLVCTIEIKSDSETEQNKDQSRVFPPILFLVDLAGAERLSTNDQSLRADPKETQKGEQEQRFINTSRTALFIVFKTWLRKERTLTFRDNILTWLLRDAFQSDSKILHIANVYTGQDAAQFTSATLQQLKELRQECKQPKSCVTGRSLP